MGGGGSGGGGGEELNIPYHEQTIAILVEARGGWLTVFFIGLLLTTVIMGKFEHVLEANVALAFFVPLIVGHAVRQRR